jgi:putative intracellular protease/amidase
MKFSELQTPSLTCTVCNGSGHYMSFSPICETCHGYGIIVEVTNRTNISVFDYMALQETISMSDLAYVISGIRDLPSARVTFNFNDFTTTLKFILNNLPGTITLKPRRNGLDIGKAFRNKVISAARSRMGGKQPDSMAVALNVMDERGIKNQSIKILTNPKEWEVVELDYEFMKLGDLVKI